LFEKTYKDNILITSLYEAYETSLISPSIRKFGTTMFAVTTTTIWFQRIYNQFSFSYK